MSSCAYAHDPDGTWQIVARRTEYFCSNPSLPLDAAHARTMTRLAILIPSKKIPL
jgi:hypothetical protein